MMTFAGQLQGAGLPSAAWHSRDKSLSLHVAFFVRWPLLVTTVSPAGSYIFFILTLVQ